MPVMMKSFVFVACLLSGLQAIRVSDSLDDVEVPPAKQLNKLALLDFGCQIDHTDVREEDEHLLNKTRNEDMSLAMVLAGDSPLDRNDYWEAFNAHNRCQRMAGDRKHKLLIGGISILIVGNIAWGSMTYGMPYFDRVISPIVESFGELLFQQYFPVLESVVGNLFNFAFKMPLYSLYGLFSALAFATGAVFTAGPALIFISAVSAAALVPIFLNAKGAEKVVQLSVDMVKSLFGYGNKRPICCCSPEETVNTTQGTEKACAMVSFMGEGAAMCPLGLVHDAAECPAIVSETFNDQQTAEGCVCKDWSDCQNNKYYKGHSWCEVGVLGRGETGRACGNRWSLFEPTRRWDYCRHAGYPLEYAFNSSSGDEADALATFLPNRFLRRATGSVWTSRTYVSPIEATVSATSATGHECFAAIAEESMSGCATMCLNEGAPTARTMASQAGCSGFSLVPLFAFQCPTDCNSLPKCAEIGLQIGDICEADGECGTDRRLDNCCGAFDVYRKVEEAPTPAPTAPPREVGDFIPSGLHDRIFPCAGFAFNRAQHLCLRLPDFAVDAQFPFFDANGNGEGWQHFVSKYEDVDKKGVCDAETMRDIVDRGWTITQDKNNGHLYVDCLGEDRMQKVSCIRKECGDTADWCMVQNHCRKGVWSVFGGCQPLRPEEALSCAGEHGSVPGGEVIANYWDVSNSMNRCMRANRISMINVALAGPILFMVGEYVAISVVTGGWLATTAANIMQTTFPAILNFFWKNAVTNAAYYFFSAIWGFITQLPALFMILPAMVSIIALVGNVAVFGLGTFAIALAPSALTLLGPPLVVMGGTVWTTGQIVEAMAGFLGFGGQYPKCCCKMVPDPESNATVKACGVTAPLRGTEESCPLDWTNEPDQCEVSELVVYSETQSVAGCQCKDYEHCNTNEPHNGHAWCHVQPLSWGAKRTCGHSNLFGDRWDYCMLSSNNVSNQTNTADDFDLGQFIPNTYGRIDIFGPGNPFAVGTWTDNQRMVTTARPPNNYGQIQEDRECFVALPIETSGGCAKACIQEGSTSAQNNTYPCVAFAWHQEQKLCVRLPYWAADAKYTPFKNKEGQGWQNFVTKYFAHRAEAVCSVETLEAVRLEGYAIARDKNNGHLYLRCQEGNNLDSWQKASCIPRECGGQEWCLVKNHCGRWFNRCKALDPTQGFVLNCPTPALALS